MKDRLEQYTVHEFVDFVCHGAKQGDAKQQAIYRDVLFEYQNIADPKGARSYLRECDKTSKARITVSLLQMCTNLIALGAYDSVRSVLNQAGIRTAGMNDKRLTLEVKSRLAKAKKQLSDSDKEPGTIPDANTIRRDFDAQTAALMAHFKFQIDTSTMKANIYAHLISRHNNEIQTKLSAMKKK